MRVLDLNESLIQVSQVNASISFGKGTTRGMHYLGGKHAEKKIVSVLHGAIQDIVVCIDTQSSDYGEVRSYLLVPGSESLYVPRGYAHGFQVLSDFAVVTYNVDISYRAAADSGISPYSPMIGNLWKLPIGVISEKDRNLPDFPPKNSLSKCQCC
jgi:dTDP-4-dehydrorhamnose 3,5-epimerase